MKCCHWLSSRKQQRLIISLSLPIGPAIYSPDFRITKPWKTISFISPRWSMAQETRMVLIEVMIRSRMVTASKMVWRRMTICIWRTVPQSWPLTIRLFFLVLTLMSLPACRFLSPEAWACMLFPPCVELIMARVRRERRICDLISAPCQLSALDAAVPPRTYEGPACRRLP